MDKNENRESRRKYMREYMKTRYNLDKEKSRNIKNSIRIIKINDISDEEKNKYGEYLADIIKLKKIVSKIPKEFVEEIYNDIPSMRGWESQQIVKSSFWKLNLCKNYMMIDSDSYFIKEFTCDDFLYDDETPYTVMHEQKDLFSYLVVLCLVWQFMVVLN